MKRKGIWMVSYRGWYLEDGCAYNRIINRIDPNLQVKGIAKDFIKPKQEIGRKVKENLMSKNIMKSRNTVLNLRKLDSTHIQYSKHFTSFITKERSSVMESNHSSFNLKTQDNKEGSTKEKKTKKGKKYFLMKPKTKYTSRILSVI